MMNKGRAIGNGLLAAVILLAVYFAILTAVSGWGFAQSQFGQFWYFIVSLAAGFGIQIGLYIYLKNAIHAKNAGRGVVAVSGTTSTAAMISCCAHYLANILPILGATGLVAFAAQYQVKLFWAGIAFNLAGIIYIGRRVRNFKADTMAT